mgnify:CR=1 FL=1
MGTMFLLGVFRIVPHRVVPLRMPRGDCSTACEAGGFSQSADSEASFSGLSSHESLRPPKMLSDHTRDVAPKRSFEECLTSTGQPFSPLQSVIDMYNRSRPVALLPWEREPYDAIFNAGGRARSSNPQISVLGASDYFQHVPAAVSPSPDIPINPFAAKRARLATYIKSEDSMRHQALQKIRMMLFSDPAASALGLLLIRCAVEPGSAELVQKSVEDTFSAKATATLTKRTAALWSVFRLVHGFGCMPLRYTEEQV